ncbi:hypothetical protein A0H81_08549 [Grifola frondosa]|uniref:Uncharacterized protein n=1 Tax=Grifola frondosa TaxID=5627 RepID=A0A1C7M2B7_GRIFR|nr:hypothetical protein A0H81_08549 [Grifola frondosa]
MSTSDVDAGLSPDANRWTVHDFKGVLDPDVLDRTRSADIPHKQPLRVPVDESQWPPRVIFDSIYASVIARYFGHEDFTVFARNHWQSRHYPGSHRNTCDKERREGRLNQRHDRADAIEEEMDPLDMIFCISQFTRAPQKAEQCERWTMEQLAMEAAKRAELDQKVTSWMRAVT